MKSNDYFKKEIAEVCSQKRMQKIQLEILFEILEAVQKLSREFDECYRKFKSRFRMEGI